MLREGNCGGGCHAPCQQKRPGPSGGHCGARGHTPRLKKRWPCVNTPSRDRVTRRAKKKKAPGPTAPGRGEAFLCSDHVIFVCDWRWRMPNAQLVHCWAIILDAECFPRTPPGPSLGALGKTLHANRCTLTAAR